MERNDALRVFTKNSGFVMVDRKLQEVKWLRTEFKYDHKDEDFLLYTAHTIFQKPDGTTGVLNDYDMAFDSVEKYEKGVSAETSYKTLFIRKNDGDVLRDVIRGVKRSFNPEYWVFDKLCHVPVQYKLELEEFYFDYSDNRFHTDEFPKDCKIYDTKEEALSYNTYKIIEQDGTEYERDGVNKLIMLDDDQRELLKQFEDICKKMNDADMLLISDSCEDMSVFNLRHIKNYALDYNDVPDVMDGDPEDYERADRYGMPFKVNHHIQWWGDDSSLFILRKSTENGEK
jgi:hypothetical protein